ncbi:tetratricopeptide repeat-containing glycosyltransferase family 2 protein [Paenibacillus radicis (ex Gao et al. 2016)]|nr:glycosyltransferase family 2 protein [Paenibacillus radicis (ex Gao et al. 2016)]
MRRKLISLCMIVKDEEAFLADCLESVKGIADEIIIVDTGSTDRTTEIAARYGAVIVHYEWDHDFAKARNAGLDRAKGEWILFLDADERLDAATKGQLLDLIKDKSLSAMLLQIWNIVGDGEGQGATIHPVLRMFRNDKFIRFEGRIHEQIAPSILRKFPGARFHLTDAIIHHYGYKHQVVESKGKLKRNMELLKLAIAEEPENSFHRYNIGVEHLRVGEPEEALAAFRLVRNSPDFELLNYAHLVNKYEALSLQLLGRWQEAADSATEATVRFPTYTDMWHYKSLAHAQLAQLPEARAAAERAIELGVSPPQYHTEDGMGTFRTAYLLGRLCEALQDDQAVIRYYVLALRMKSSLLPPLFRLCAYYRSSGRSSAIGAILVSKLHCPDERSIMKVAGVMNASGCGQAALSWLEWHASTEKDSTLKQSLTDLLVRFRSGDHSALPFGERLSAANEQEGGEAREQRVSSKSWRDLADARLDLFQKSRRTALEQRAITAIRIQLPFYEGW